MECKLYCVNSVMLNFGGGGAWGRLFEDLRKVSQYFTFSIKTFVVGAFTNCQKVIYSNEHYQQMFLQSLKTDEHCRSEAY